MREDGFHAGVDWIGEEVPEGVRWVWTQLKERGEGDGGEGWLLGCQLEHFWLKFGFTVT